MGIKIGIENDKIAFEVKRNDTSKAGELTPDDLVEYIQSSKSPLKISNVVIDDPHLVHVIANASSGESGGTELDSHADSAVVGKNCYVLRKTGKVAKVQGFTSALGKPLLVPFVDAIVAYDDPTSGNTMLLKIRNALYVQSLHSNLIPPFLMRLAGIEVNECPKFLSKHPTEHDHSLFFKDEDVRIPLELRNTISYIPSRIPTQDELQVMNTPDIKLLLLTPDSPSWNPHNSNYTDQEKAMTDSFGNILQRKEKSFLISDVVSKIIEPSLLCNALIDRCNASGTPVQMIKRVNCVLEDGLTAFNSNNILLYRINVVRSRGATSDLSP